MRPQTELADKLAPYLSQPLTRETRVADLLTRPEMKYAVLMEFSELGPGVENISVAQQIEIQAKYAGYLTRQHKKSKNTNVMRNLIFQLIFRMKK